MNEQEMTPIEKAQADTAFQLFLARSFGHRFEAEEENYVLRGYLWRDIYFVTEMVRKERQWSPKNS